MQSTTGNKNPSDAERKLFQRDTILLNNNNNNNNKPPKISTGYSLRCLDTLGLKILTCAFYFMPLTAQNELNVL